MTTLPNNFLGLPPRSVLGAALVLLNLGRSVAGQVLPAEFVNDRIFVAPQTADGQKLRFYTDTGGGTFVLESAAKRLGLSIESSMDEDGELRLAALPPLMDAHRIPSVASFGGRMPVFQPPKQEPMPFGDADGLLGQAWFADRVWTFDYLQGRLVLEAGSLPAPPATNRTVKLGFKQNGQGVRQKNFPRIEIEVDEAPLDMLFDTGAMTTLTKSAIMELGETQPPQRATSFITTKVFDSWRAARPDWPLLEDAESTTGEAMIRVPRVTIAGFSVGPVWFTRRKDANFHQYMSQWMDKRIEGAVGGNILRHFCVTVDYPKAEAIFVPGPGVVREATDR